MTRAVVSSRTGPFPDDLDQEFPAERAGGVIKPQKLAFLPRLHFRRIVWMVEAQAFDRVGDGPFLKLGSQRAAEFEIERARSRLLDRPRDPEVVVQGAEQGLAPVFSVEEHAIAGSARGDPGRRLDREQLESRYALAGRSGVVRDLLELRAMVDGERHDRRRLRAPRRRPMDVVQRLVLAQGAMGRAAAEKPAEFGPGRIFGRTQEPRHGESARRIGERAARLERAWDAVARAQKDGDPFCRGVVLLGLEAPEDDLAQAFAVARHCGVVKGFAVGRTIFVEPAADWFARRIDDREAVERMANVFARLCALWRGGTHGGA